MFTTIRGALLILFLYLGLVWTVSIYRNGIDGDFIGDALVPTIAGFALFLVLVVVSFLVGFGRRLFGMWTAMRARRSAHPRETRRVPPGDDHPDDATLRALLSEAVARLRISPRFSGQDPDELFSGFPLYLVVGREGSGKTSIIANSGMEPQFLAGSVPLDSSSPPPTSLANIWLGGDALFVEVGGRHFAGDTQRWEALMGILAASVPVPLWQRIRKGRRPGLQLRGLIQCCDLGVFLSRPGPEEIERESRLMRDRLCSVVKAFGRQFPVYTVFSKADQIAYFGDFCGRFAPSEVSHVLGCTLPLSETNGPTDPSDYVATETRRLTKSLQGLYRSLTQRRLSVLYHEPVVARKPGIFEFPREFNRLRHSLAGFLVQTFRPGLLESIPVNRGFYFTGTRQVEAVPTSPDATRTLGELGSVDQTARISIEATQMFRADLTQAIRSGRESVSVRGGFAAALRPQWVFLSGLFREILLNDSASEVFAPIRQRPFPFDSMPVRVSTLAVSALLLVLLTVSLARNRSLIAEVALAAPAPDEAIVVGQAWPPSVDQLRALDDLRVQVQRLSDLHTEGVPLTMRWLLYSGRPLDRAVRRAYFGSLESGLLDRVGDELGRWLESLPDPQSPGSPATTEVRDRLRAYRMVSSPRLEGCLPSEALVSTTLVAAMDRAGLSAADPRFELARRQVGFYAGVIAGAGYADPAGIEVDPGAYDHALDFLNRSGGTDEVYQSLLAEVERGLDPPAPASVGVLSGPARVRPAYSPEGGQRLQDVLRTDLPASGGDPCLPGLAVATTSIADLGETGRDEIEERYKQDYQREWRAYLSGFSVRPFVSASDASDKLRILGDGSASPLLALFRTVGENTSASSAGGAGAGGLLAEVFSRIGGGSEARVEDNPFQPVHQVVSPDDPLWASEENTPYLEGLAALSEAMSAVARTPRDAELPALQQVHQQAQAAVADARTAVRLLSLNFRPDPVYRLNEVVRQLLDAPIDQAERFIRTDFRSDEIDRLRQTYQRDLTRLCAQLAPVLSGFPFMPQATTSASLEEFRRMFDPVTGAVFNAPFLAALTERVDGGWRRNPAAADLGASQELLDFLRRAQDIADAFFPEGNLQLFYVLRPVLANDEQIIELSIDGRSESWRRGETVQQLFAWPDPTNPGVQGAAGSDTNKFTFYSDNGAWAAFRFFADAAGRRPGDRLVEWNQIGGQPLNPPVQLQIVEFPGDVDVFHPSFLGGLTCPRSATD